MTTPGLMLTALVERLGAPATGAPSSNYQVSTDEARSFQPR